MKLVYCIASVYNPGGMERVLLNKVKYLSSRGYQIAVVTTDQQGKNPFYQFPDGVELIDLGINYSLDNGKNPIVKIFSYFKKRREHKKRLSKLLYEHRPDITISLYPSESSFIPKIKDGSKKVLELHFCKFFRLQYGRKGLLGLADRYRTHQDECIVKRFDKFVVLSNEDAGYWGPLRNLEVIPNAALENKDYKADGTSKRVIAVGRLDYQKGFDRLLKAWALISKELTEKGWHLDIFGQGEWEQMLRQMIQQLGIEGSAKINAPTNNIWREYADSAFLVMSSHYEGFPMVLIEAMSCGIPAIAYDFKCGAKDIIIPNENGLIVKEGDIEALATAMEHLIRDNGLRAKMAAKAPQVTQRYSEQTVMAKWENCFKSIL